MQPIQDKDFDKLFKNALEDAEITPSKDLWSNIESKIEPKKKRVIPVYWLSAAAVLLIATVSILVYQQQNTTDSGKKLAGNIVQKVTPTMNAKSVKDSPLVVAPVEKLELNISSKPSTVLANTKVKEDVKPVEKQKVVTAPEMQKQETYFAKVDEPKKDIKTKIEEAILQPKEETVIASNPTVIKTDEVTGDDIQIENKSIRNVGDVVNLIVNKVDKRKDKFIQFRTDDDDSSIASINFGPFKIGKRNKK